MTLSITPFREVWGVWLTTGPQDPAPEVAAAALPLAGSQTLGKVHYCLLEIRMEQLKFLPYSKSADSLGSFGGGKGR